MSKPSCSHEGCHAKAHGTSPLCTFHDPNFQHRISEARVKGGKHSGKGIGVDIQPPRTIADVATVLGDVLPALARGRISDARCQNLVRVCELLMRALDTTYEKRLQELESRLKVNNAKGQTTNETTN